jgi:hypothetical protein
LFEVNAAPLLHHLSGGVLRTANSLIDSAMAVASDQDLKKISSELLARVAENEFGLSAAGFDLQAQPATLPVLTPAAVAPVILFADTEEAAVPPAKAAVPPAEDAEDAPAAIEIPELIQDTLPNLEILAPGLAVFEPESEPEPKAIAIPELALEVPELPKPTSAPAPVVEVKIAAESDGEDVPAWDRDPTVAELRPDIEALEAALAFGRNDDPEPVDVAPEQAPKPQPKEPELMPEITLDHAISQRIANNLIDEPGEISAPAPKKDATTAVVDRPARKPATKTPQKADAELEKIASGLAKAKSLEDVDDRMAETLFGDEINFVAAQFMARPPREVSANDDTDIVSEDVPMPANADGDNDDEAPGYEVTLQATRKLDDGGMDLSASQRLKTVRALNADLHPSIREKNPAAASISAAVAKPDPIEDQINTSMTQTLKALNVRPPVNDDGIDDGESKGGFFSRFKRP